MECAIRSNVTLLAGKWFSGKWPNHRESYHYFSIWKIIISDVGYFSIQGSLLRILNEKVIDHFLP